MGKLVVGVGRILSRIGICWRGAIVVLVLLFASAFLGGCNPPPPPTAQTMTMTCKQPTFAALPQTKEFQEKGGLQISVAPASYVCMQTSSVSRREVPDPLTKATLGLLPPAPHKEGTRYIETTETPSLEVAPTRLEFTVKINNKLSRVFRGAGIVVQFNVAGKLQAVDQQNYADLTNSIVPPRTEQQFKIYGPALSSVPDQTTIGLFLYDVVSNTDAAGNITGKNNFEWFYTYAVQHKQEVGEIRKTEGWQ
jgi:hypothetical protein